MRREIARGKFSGGRSGGLTGRVGTAAWDFKGCLGWGGGYIPKHENFLHMLLLRLYRACSRWGGSERVASDGYGLLFLMRRTKGRGGSGGIGGNAGSAPVRQWSWSLGAALAEASPLPALPLRSHGAGRKHGWGVVSAGWLRVLHKYCVSRPGLGSWVGGG